MRFQNAVRCLPSCVLTLTIAYGGSTAKPNELGARESAQLSVNPAVTAVGSFAMDLYGQLAMENPGKNLFFPPYSMSSVLAMTAEGARGETAEQMGKVLGFPQAARDMALIHAGMLESNERLQSRQVPQELRDQLAATRKALEESRTQEKKLIAAGQDARRQQVSPLSPAAPFEKNVTMREDFQTGAARKVSVSMMRKDKLEGGRYGAFNIDGSLFATPQRVSSSSTPDPKTLYPDKGGFLVAELPYKGRELSMVLLVPQNPDGLRALEKNLTSANLQTWLNQLESRDMNVQMPKFKLETDYQEMKKTLQAMGMVRAFSSTDAQFEGICASEPLYISKVCHKAFVEVTEQGTEAAAATAVSGKGLGPAPPDQPFTPTFRADKPFLFAIRDVKTGTVLFLGRIMNPIH